ncbi:MAG: ORF6N domain-containing protein [Lachnospiraceae bacterium]|nr:ORF6N domain-containing protein [Lachnospiraceae bacterium]
MNNFRITPIENEGKRVLTTAQLAESYGTDSKVISNNFNRNKERYTEGKHYYCLTGEVLKEFKTNHQIDESLIRINTLYLWTEKGALLHAKSLNTDKAWEIYDFLVEFYFRVQEEKIAYNPPINNRELDIKEQEVKLRQAELLFTMSSVNTLSENYKNILIAKSAEILTGEPVLALPKSEQKTYSAGEIGQLFGVSAQAIGRLATKHNLKTDEYGEWYHDKSKYSSKEVDTFRYNDNAVKKFRDILEK